MTSLLLRLEICLFLLLALYDHNMTEAFRGNKRTNTGRRHNASYNTRLGETRLRHGEDRVGSTTSSAVVQAAARFKNFEQVLDTFHAEPVIIYFSTQKCGPCQLMKREVDTVRKIIGAEMKMFSIDTEKWPRVGARFAVSRLPCLVVVHEGEIKLRLEGVNKAEEVVELVRMVR
jgi:thioredoxin-like negative regulator of GroEL